jgi:hypothetical protein
MRAVKPDANVTDSQKRKEEKQQLQQFYAKYRNNKPDLIQRTPSEEALISIEQFVADCLASQKPGFRITTRHGQVQFNETVLSRGYFHRLNSFNSRYNKTGDYSPPVKLFFSVCQELQLIGHEFILPRALNAQCVSDAELFNALISRIREKGSTLPYRKQVAQEGYRAFRRFEGLVDYVDALFEHVRSRLIVIRLDLKYREEHVGGMKVGQAQEDFKHFLDNMRSKPSLFADLAGYIWKLEQGEYGSEHFHVILFFTNDSLLNDSYRAEQIGKYWELVITKGRGCYFNCNREVEKAKQKRLCLGRVDYYDNDKRYNLLFLLAYFCKDEQRLQVKPKKRSRPYGRGVMPIPVIEESRKGAPRKYDVPSRAYLSRWFKCSSTSNIQELLSI